MRAFLGDEKFSEDSLQFGSSVVRKN